MRKPIKGSIEYKILGPEPLEYTKDTLNWFNYFSESKDTKKWFNDYLKSKKLKLSYDRVPSYIGVISYFINSKRKLPKDILDKFNKFVNSLEVNNKEEIVKKYIPKKGIQEFINDQVRNYCSVLDGEIDNFIDNNYTTEFQLSKFTSNIGQMQAKRIKDFYTRQLDDVLTDDEFSKEGYSYMNETQKNKYIIFLKNIMSSLDKRILMPKEVKPTKKKAIKHKVSKIDVTLNTSSKEYNIVGKKVENIIDSKFALLFDVKNKTLTYLVSNGIFNLRGVTLDNVDLDKSFKIILRNPLDTLPKLKTQISIDKTIQALTTKKQEVSRRINKNMILLKVL